MRSSIKIIAVVTIIVVLLMCFIGGCSRDKDSNKQDQTDITTITISSEDDIVYRV